MRQFSSASIVLAVSLFASVSQAQGAAPKGFDRYAEEAMRDWKVPGVAIAVVKDDAVLFSRGYGVRDIAGKAPVTPSTVFALGSVTKSFTAALVAQDVAAGRLQWDDALSARLPGFVTASPALTATLTLRDVLAHRSGLPRGDMMWYASQNSRDENVRRVRYMQPDAAPRTGFSYQNVLYLAAGQAVGAANHSSWDALMRDRLLAPLGMRTATTSMADLRAMSDVATPHAIVNDTLRTVPRRDGDNVAPAIALNASALDMAQWIRMELNGGTLDGREIVAAAALRETQRAQQAVPLSPASAELYPGASSLDYGMGWFISDYRGDRVLQHGGNIDGMSALVVLVPARHIGFVILTNLDRTAMPSALAYRLIDDLVGRAPHDWSGEMLRTERAIAGQSRLARQMTDARAAISKGPTHALAQYAGTFADSLYGDLSVRVENGALVATLRNTISGTLQPLTDDSFRIEWSDPMVGSSTVSFRMDDESRVSAAHLDGLASFGVRAGSRQ
ncbi:MAG: beta-lactamase [Gemmatimonadetes bacterium]|nr:beta-lactamase [Gemmatimonadota bacterium]